MINSTQIPMASSVVTKSPTYGSITSSPAATSTTPPVLSTPAAKTFVDNQISSPAPSPTAPVNTPLPQSSFGANASNYNPDPLIAGMGTAKTPQELAGANTTASGSGSTQPGLQLGDVDSGAAPQTAYDAAMNTYLDSLKSANALGLQAKKDQEKALDSGETLGFATGEAARVNKNNAFALDAATNLTNANKEAVAGLKDRLPAAPAAFSLNPGETRFDASGNAIASLPAKPASLTDQYGSGSIGEYNFAKSQGYTGSFTQYQNEDANRKAKAVAAASEPNRVLSATEAQALGVPFGTTASQAYGKTPQKALTEAQAKDVTYGERGKEANTTIDQLESTIAKYNQFAFAAATAAEGSTLASPYAPDEIKQLRQAERNFSTAILRRESGAAISAGEFATVEKQYFPRPGDDAATLKQKAQNRETAINSFLKNANQGGNTSAPSANDPLGLGI